MFQVFRRHQKRLLAVVTILAMFAFVFPLGSTYFGRSDRTPRNKTEVKDEIYGKPVTNQDIANAARERQLANAFVYSSVIASDFRMAQLGQDYIEGVFGFGPVRDDEAIKDSIRLAHKADVFGIKVSDEIVRSWIKDVTSGKLTTEKFQQAVAQVGRSVEGGLTAETMFDILRNQIRIQLAGGLAMGRVRGGALQVTPYEAWQFYRRLNDKFGLEIIPVAVADFTDKIDDPGDDPLRELYAKHVGQLPDPGSPEPGFKEPRKLNLQYASGNLDDFMLAMMPELEITDEEVQQYYETNKHLYRVTAPEESPSVGPAEVPEKPKIEVPQPEASDKEKSPPVKDEGEPKKDKDAPKKDTPENPSPDASPDPKSDNLDEDIELDDPPATPRQEENPKPQETTKPEGKPSTDDPPTKSPDGQDASKPGKPEASQEPPKESTAKDEAKESQKPDAETAKPDDAAMPTEPKDEPRYKPIEEVTKEIRDLIRKDKAKAELTKRIARMTRIVADFEKAYGRAKDKHEMEKETNPDLAFVPPPAPDFSASAAELGLKFVETGLVALDEEFLKLPGLGDAMETRGGRMSFRMVPTVMNSTELYEPAEFHNSKDDYICAWKVADVPEQEPEFSDVRDRVLAAYRTIKARELAKEHASKLADALRNLGGDFEKFRDQNPDAKSLSFDPISLWTNAPTFSMNMMGRQGRIRPTDLPGLQYPTDELRTNIFKLEPGEVTVASNQPEDSFYVVLVTKREPSSRENFARSRLLIEDQVLQEQLEKMRDQMLQALRDESKSPKGKAPAGN